MKDKINEAYEKILNEGEYRPGGVELPATLDSIDDYIDMINQALKKDQPSGDLSYAENEIPAIISKLKKIHIKVKKLM